MKILLVSRRYYPEVIGGGQISAHAIAKALVQAGQDVHVLTFITEGERIDEVLDAVKITRLAIRKLRWFPKLSNMEWMYYEMYRQTKRFLKEFKPDVIHALNGETVPSIAFLSKKTRIPWVATINGPWLFCFPGEGTDSKGNNCLGCHGLQRFNEIMLKWGSGGVLAKLKTVLYWSYSYPHMYLLSSSTHKADFVLPVSTGFRDSLIRLGFPAGQLRVVRNPIELKKKTKSNIRSKLRIPAQAKVLLFAGRLTESKGVQQIIKSLTMLPNVHVIVAGKGLYADELKELAKNLGIMNRVHFVGFVLHNKLPEYYSIADIVIMAGTFYEALSRMLLEACAMGIPVIATDRGGNTDSVEQGKNGYLLKSQDVIELVSSIKKIIDSPARAKAMGLYGQSKIKKEFSPKHIAQNLVDVYRELAH